MTCKQNDVSYIGGYSLLSAKPSIRQIRGECKSDLEIIRLVLLNMVAVNCGTYFRLTICAISAIVC